MNYIEQLQQIPWLNKRLEVLKRDSNKCQNCFNLNYQSLFKSGIIFNFKSDKLNFKRITDDNSVEYLVRVWNLKENRLATSNIRDIEININENYIAFYDNQNLNYPNIIALKRIENSNVEILPLLNVIKEDHLKGKVSEKTYNHIYQQVSENDDWFFVKRLHIHHKCYQEGKLAWEYDLSKLQTLCWTCHETLHKEQTIPVLDEHGNEKGFLTNCTRCHGAGIFPEFKHIDFGVCFRCNGKKFEEYL